MPQSLRPRRFRGALCVRSRAASAEARSYASGHGTGLMRAVPRSDASRHYSAATARQTVTRTVLPAAIRTPASPAVPACTGSGSEIPVRSATGPACGSGSEMAHPAPVSVCAAPGGCPATAPAVDEQAPDGIRHAVQGRTHGRKAAEHLPPFLIFEADLERHAPAVRMPGPIDGAVGQRRLDQRRVVLLLPPESREPAVQYFN